MAITADVAVYGDHIASVLAACAAAERGARVVLFSPYRHYGTPFSEGLGRIDVSSAAKNKLGWLQKEFFNRLAIEGGGWKGRLWTAPPSICELVCLDMLKARGVMVIDDREISSVSKTGNVINSVTLTGGSGDTINATVWVDGDEDGDLLAMAGVPWISGRESEATYGESIAGYRPGFFSAIDTSGVTYGLKDDPALTVGDADDGITVMSYRFTVTNQPGNQMGWVRPDGADDALIELRKRRQGYQSETFNPLGANSLARGIWSAKTDINQDLLPHPDLATWPTATRAERKAIATTMYQEFFLWMYFLATDPSVHYNARKIMQEWQPCRDEHLAGSAKWIPTPQGIPGQPYRRGVRRLSSPGYTMTRSDCDTNKTKTDAIAVGAYGLDQHTVHFYRVPGGIKRDPDWDNDIGVNGPYEIPYSCMYDPNFTNLLVPNCMGASHVAYTSMRIDIYKGGMGVAAGWAAAECALTSTPVNSISVSALQAALVARGHILHI